MDKVLVDRGLLAECVSVCIRAFGVGDPIEAKLRAILAQPAEAEGVRDYLTEFAEGEVEAKTAIEELQDALSAVTAERDRLAAGALEDLRLRTSALELMNAANAERDQLRAEVEMLREDAERLDWVMNNGATLLLVPCDGVERFMLDFPYEGREGDEISDTYREAIDAAMAAKEA